jgi:hypothetical protein
MRQSHGLAQVISWRSVGRVLPHYPDLIVAPVLTAIWRVASEEELQDFADKFQPALCDQIGEDGAQIRVGAVCSNAGAWIQ